VDTFYFRLVRNGKKGWRFQGASMTRVKQKKEMPFFDLVIAFCLFPPCFPSLPFSGENSCSPPKLCLFLSWIPMDNIPEGKDGGLAMALLV
jgi:hypothetical protein